MGTAAASIGHGEPRRPFQQSLKGHQLRRQVLASLVGSALAMSVNGGVRAEQSLTLQTATRYLSAARDHRLNAASAASMVSPEFVDHVCTPVSTFGPAFRTARGGWETQMSRSSAPDVFDRILVDGNRFVVLRHTFTQAAPRGVVLADVFRTLGGKIQEHWSATALVPTTARNGNTMWCGRGDSAAQADQLGDTLRRPTCVQDGDATDRANSLALLHHYMQVGLVQHDLSGAARDDISPHFVQHSSYIPDGKTALVAFFKSIEKQGDAAGPAHDHVLNIIAEGSTVMLQHFLQTDHSQSGRMFIDVFRVKDHVITEHWDIVEPVSSCHEVRGSAAKGN